MDSLFDFIIDTNLSVCNKGDTPTIHFPSSEKHDSWEGVLDITLLAANGVLSITVVYFSV